jgi:hypothetical protein
MIFNRRRYRVTGPLLTERGQGLALLLLALAGLFWLCARAKGLA